MPFRRWLVRFTLPAALVLTSVVGAGWKWEHLPLP
jgi:hypothetical protein